ncbi:hypothetical protein PIB30_028364 [Stylosanthes scabra]|uniref:Uncharacterized protein n=1 Tax=Stylosanthes scabra TaxID=79078 RepID=A0ABU6RBA9_9FABA|nr:hypothetical protein [Stylosanthes scabra]
MLRNLRSRLRRRPRYGLFLCAVVSALILLSLLHTSQSNNPHRRHHHHHHHHNHHRRFLRRIRPFQHFVNYDSLLSDSVVDDASSSEDTIDALDIVDEQPPVDDSSDDDDTAAVDEEPSPFNPLKVSGYFFYHVGGVIRKAFTKSSPEDWEDGFRQVGIFLGSPAMGNEDRSKATFGSDDIPVDERVRRKVIEVKGVEDALLLKLGRNDSPLREGWGDWFDKKSDFLRKDKMLRSNLEGLNPLHNPILQDPDGVGVTGLTKGVCCSKSLGIQHALGKIVF